MALTAADKDVLELLAVEAETASTWVGGARASKLVALAAKIRKVANGDGSELSDAAKAEEERQAAIEAARKQQEEAQAAAEAAQKAKAKS